MMLLTTSQRGDYDGDILIRRTTGTKRSRQNLRLTVNHLLMGAMLTHMGELLTTNHLLMGLQLPEEDLRLRFRRFRLQALVELQRKSKQASNVRELYPTTDTRVVSSKLRKKLTLLRRFLSYSLFRSFRNCSRAVRVRSLIVEYARGRKECLSSFSRMCEIGNYVCLSLARRTLHHA